MRTKTPPPTREPVQSRRPSQADLFSKFDHLDRQRAAVALATRLLRILDSAPPETAWIALEIASTAIRAQGNPNGQPPAPPANAPVDIP